MRGCLCWAQILQIGEHRVLVTTTLFIVMTTSLAGGFILPIIIPRLGLKPIKNIESEDSPRREPLLKRSYKSHPRQINHSKSTERTHIHRKLSIYNFNYNANADDDLYPSHNNSPEVSASIELHMGGEEKNNNNNNNNSNNNNSTSNKNGILLNTTNNNNKISNTFSVDQGEHSSKHGEHSVTPHKKERSLQGYRRIFNFSDDSRANSPNRQKSQKNQNSVKNNSNVTNINNVINRENQENRENDDVLNDSLLQLQLPGKENMGLGCGEIYSKKIKKQKKIQVKGTGAYSLAGTSLKNLFKINSKNVSGSGTGSGSQSFHGSVHENVHGSVYESKHSDHDDMEECSESETSECSDGVIEEGRWTRSAKDLNKDLNKEGNKEGNKYVNRSSSKDSKVNFFIFI